MERTQIPLCRIHHLEVHKGYWRSNPVSAKTIKAKSSK
jgi:hypothetical protein